jgi:chloride channel 2
MEISHNDGLNLPVSVAILASYFTAKRFSENVYDMLITTSHLPRLQKLPKAAYDIPIWEVMKDVHDTRFLTADSTYADAWHVLSTSNEPVYPIVDSHENKFLLATVTRSRLRAAVDYCRRKMNEFASATAATSTSTKAAPSTATLLFPSAQKQPAANGETTPLLSSSDQSTAEASKATIEDFVTLGIDTVATAAEELVTMSLLDWPIHFAFRRGGKIMDWVRMLTSHDACLTYLRCHLLEFVLGNERDLYSHEAHGAYQSVAVPVDGDDADEARGPALPHAQAQQRVHHAVGAAHGRDHARPTHVVPRHDVQVPRPGAL